MAERRMHSLKIIDTDKFYGLPKDAKLLYIMLSFHGDDDGFVCNPKMIMCLLKCSEKYLDVLVQNGYVISFPSGNIVITHWKLHNNIPKDRYKPSLCIEKNLLEEHDGVYFLSSEFPISNNDANNINYNSHENILNETDSNNNLENEVHENVMHINDTHIECENVVLQDNMSENVGCEMRENVTHQDNVYEKLVMENKVHNKIVNNNIVNKTIVDDNIVQNQYNQPVYIPDTDCIHPDTSLYTQDREGMNRLDKDRSDEKRLEENSCAGVCEKADEKSFSSLSSSFSEINFDEIISNFNRICTRLTKVKYLDDDCKSLVKSALEHGYELNEIFRIVNESDFLCQTKWCKLNWILKLNNIVKILDGNYNNYKTAQYNNGFSNYTGKNSGYCYNKNNYVEIKQNVY